MDGDNPVWRRSDGGPWLDRNPARIVSDENPGGVEASDTTDIMGVADLALTKTDGVTTVTSGDGLTYAYLLTVTNAGPSDATSVVLTDSWPAGFSQGPVTASQGSCTPTAGGPDSKPAPWEPSRAARQSPSVSTSRSRSTSMAGPSRTVRPSSATSPIPTRPTTARPTATWSPRSRQRHPSQAEPLSPTRASPRVACWRALTLGSRRFSSCWW